MRRKEFGILSRAVSVRALAAARRLDEDSWRVVLADAPNAVGLELRMLAMADPDGYPRLSGPTVRELNY